MGIISIGATVGSSTGLAVTSNAAADTLSTSFVTLRAGSLGVSNVNRISLNVKVTTGTSRDFVLVLYKGASDTEFLRVPFRSSSSDRTEDFEFPIFIDGNDAVKMKCQDSTGSGVLNVAVSGQETNALVSTGAPEAVLLTTQAGSVIRTQLDTGGTANTFVSAALATTAADYNAFKVRVRDASSGNVADSLWRLKDDGTAFYQYGYKRLTNAAAVTVWSPTIYHDVASGSAITVEGESSSTTINDLEFTLWGMVLPTPTSTGGAGRLVGTGGLV